MKKSLLKAAGQWFQEILLAWQDARETKPFAELAGTPLTDADLF